MNEGIAARAVCTTLVAGAASRRARGFVAEFGARAPKSESELGDTPVSAAARMRVQGSFGPMLSQFPLG